MLIIKILLCLALYPSWSSTITVEERAKLDDELEKALKEVSKDQNPGDDVLIDLGPMLDRLVKADGAVGKVVHDELSPESDEYKAFLDFKTRSDVIWKDINRPHNEFGEEVESWMIYMTVMSREYLFDKRNERLHVRASHCRHDNIRPIHILKHLKSHLITECGDSITTKEVEDMTKHRKHCKGILRQALRRFQVVSENAIPDPSEYLSGTNAYKFSALQGSLRKSLFPKNHNLFITKRKVPAGSINGTVVPSQILLFQFFKGILIK
ncbi:hypothetical protein CAEBREN_04014 [Caenorhabditis brenneri]|uniref:Uncharacterized protein n=1 Tax=Caenorhabditis brenneri TaxID=135651 RepID=G0PFI5_CAEBE|nr:hypothetical protein CAEBREN_04014 [Caenorhabditis brenneri]